MTRKKNIFSSIRGLFLLVMSMLILALSLPQLFAGSKLLDGIIFQLGTELLGEKLESLIQPIDRRYETLRRVGLEDSQSHLDEIKTDGLAKLAATRYKETGRVFVVNRDRTILLSEYFQNSSDPEFSAFFTQLASDGRHTLSYTVSDRNMLAVSRYYTPWQSYIGLCISYDELFAAKNLFLRISLLVLALALIIALAFMIAMQKFIISPIIKLSRFAEKISQGDYQQEIGGKSILELATLQHDIAMMVETLKQQMEDKTKQLEIIRKRKRELDQALTELQRSENRYRAIYNAPSDAIFIHNGETGEILDVNQTMLDLYGYTKEEALKLTAETASSNVVPFTPQEALQKMHAAIAIGPQLFEWHARKKDGSLFWVEVALKSARFYGNHVVIAVVRDISDRKKAERALAEEKERLTITLRSIGDGVITTDTEGRVVLINKAAENLTGWLQDEALGKPLGEIFDIINEKSGKKCENPAEKVLATGNIIELANHTVLIHRNGQRRHIADSGAPIRDQESRIIGVVLVFRDVTEKIHFAAEMLKAKKLESIGVLAGGIAHDFNNILAAILGNINLAKLQVKNTNTAHLLDQAEKASLRAKNLTQQLLTFARGGAPLRQPTSISEIIRESATFVLRGSNVSCAFDLADNLWLGDIDPGQISQVIQNMVINARQAMPEGGTVAIACRNRTTVPHSKNSAPTEFLEISISDSGIGIPGKYLDKIFDPYFSRKQEGTGLGLAICHSIVANHGGRIDVTSFPGKGTSFTILLPASKEVLPQEQAKKPNSPPVRNAKILIMDDEEIVRSVVISMLEHLGFEGVTAEDGEEAIRLYGEAAETGKPFDAVVMDLTIPGGMGGELAVKHILALDDKAKVVVSSGYSNDPIMAEYRNYGFCAAISKPFQIDELIDIFNKILNGAP